MSCPETLETPRLCLRRWSEADHAPFADLNADPEVMQFFPARLTVGQSSEFIDRIERSFETDGLGLWALELRSSGEFIGYTGLWPATFKAAFTPAVEVGWRLARRHWGAGFATEAALRATEDGFERLGLSEIVSFTSRNNQRSRSVMEKLGFIRSAARDFDHPSLKAGDPLRPHVLYQRSRIDWACRREDRFRPARNEDRPWIDSLRRRVYADLFNATFGGWEEAHHLRHERVCWERGGLSVLTQDGERIGMLQLATAEGSIEVCEIQIRPEDQGRGIGSEILRKIQLEAKRDKRAVHLSVPRQNLNAQRLYARLGFEQTGSNESHFHLSWSGGAETNT